MGRGVVNCGSRIRTLVLLVHFLLFFPANLDADDGDSLLLIRDELRIANPGALSEWNLTSICGSREVNCSENGTVISLDLSNRALQGPIPPQIGLLRSLEYLYITTNNFSGALPSEIMGISTLQALNIDHNRLTGELPPEIGNLINLRALMAGNNSFEGEIPREVGSLVKLQKLSLWGNKLIGGIPPETGSLTELSELKLHHNFLFGNIPKELGNLGKLRALILTDNRLIGGVPKSLSGLVSIEEWKMDENMLSGSIPEFIGAMKSLKRLHVGTNFFTGPIPAGLVNKAVQASHNYLNGTFLMYTGPARSVVNNCLTNETGQRPYEVCDKFYRDESIKGCKLCENWLYLEVPTCNCLFPIEVKLRSFNPLPSTNNLVSELASGLNTTADKIIHKEWSSVNHTVVFWILPQKCDRFNRTEEAHLRFLFNNTLITLKTFGAYELVHLLNRQKWVQKDSVNASNDGNQRTSYKDHRKKGGIGVAHLVMIVIGSSIVVGILTLILCLCIARHWKPWLKRHASLTKTRSSAVRSSESTFCERVSEGSKFQLPHPYSLSELQRLTNSWSPDKEIGAGGYGKVYRAVTDTGEEIAIKRAQNWSRIRREQFQNEVAVLSRVHHLNLLRLLGYCEEGCEEILVFEYMSNGTLLDHLRRKDGTTLSWEMRLKIALQTARGLDYLHSSCDPSIIHRDVKSTNILLDKDMSVKVSDFGISKLLDANQSTVSTRVAGTIGYLDPAFLITQKLTRASDVYSFGVVLIELITGQECGAFMNSHPESHITDWALNRFNEGGIESILDPKLQSGAFPKEALTMLAKVAFPCVKEKRKERPTMKDVVRGIEMCLAKAVPEAEADPESGSLTEHSAPLSAVPDVVDIEAQGHPVHDNTIILGTPMKRGNSVKVAVLKAGVEPLTTENSLTTLL